MKTPLQYYWQRNPRYNGLKLGNSKLSFQSYGCFTCCLAYMADLDPKVAMQKLIQGGAYSGALIKSEVAAKVLGLKYLGKDTNINNMPNWTPTIKEVRLGKSQHFVIRLINPDGSKKIFDTWVGSMQHLNHYPFISYRLFKR